jgi:hypothetical protein
MLFTLFELTAICLYERGTDNVKAPVFIIHPEKLATVEFDGTVRAGAANF